MSASLRIFVCVLVCVIVVGCRSPASSEDAASQQRIVFESADLPERDGLNVISALATSLPFVHPSEDGGGLFVVESDANMVRLLDADLRQGGRLMVPLYQQRSAAGGAERVWIRGLLYAVPSALQEDPADLGPPLEKTAATDDQTERQNDVQEENLADETGAKGEDGATSKPVLFEGALSDATATLRGRSGQQRVLWFDDKGRAAEGGLPVSNLDASPEMLPRARSLRFDDLKDATQAVVIRRGEQAAGLRMSMVADQAPFHFPSGHVIAPARDAHTGDIRGWWFLSANGLELLDERMNTLATVVDEETSKPLAGIQDAAFVSMLPEGGLLVSMKRHGGAFELYFLGELQANPAFVQSEPEEDDEARTEDVSKHGRSGGEENPSTLDQDVPSVGTTPAVDTSAEQAAALPFEAKVRLLRNEEGKPLTMNFLSREGAPVPDGRRSVLRHEGLYFAVGPGAFRTQWSRIYRANAEGWTVFDHKRASGFAEDDPTRGTMRSLLSPFLFDAGERGLFLALGEQGVFLDVAPAHGDDWTLHTMNVQHPRLKAALHTSTRSGWVYLEGTHRESLRGRATPYALAFHLPSERLLVFENIQWVGALSGGDFLSPFQPERLLAAAVLGRAQNGELFAVDADHPEDGRVVLGTLPEETAEIVATGISIGPRRLLTLRLRDGRSCLALVDIRKKGSLRFITRDVNDGGFRVIDAFHAPHVTESLETVSGF